LVSAAEAWILTFEGPVAGLRRTLEGSPGVEFLREIGPGRLVVVCADGARPPAGLPGVISARRDDLEHLDG
jgi:hypothetical protein